MIFTCKNLVKLELLSLPKASRTTAAHTSRGNNVFLITIVYQISLTRNSIKADGRHYPHMHTLSRNYGNTIAPSSLCLLMVLYQHLRFGGAFMCVVLQHQDHPRCQQGIQGFSVSPFVLPRSKAFPTTQCSVHCLSRHN